MAKLNFRVQNEVDKPIGHIFQEEQANIVNAMNRDMEKVAEQFPQWIQKQSALYSQRLKNVPMIPENLNDKVIEGDWGKNFVRRTVFIEAC